MTWGSTLALFGSLVVLAALPSLSVLTVVTRSASRGLWHGVCVALGIVLGDSLFILLALGGLAIFGGWLGDFAPWLRLLAGLYLILLGVNLYRYRPPSSLLATPPAPASSAPDESLESHLETQDPARPLAALGASFWLGLGITLADQKATVFYLGFLPAFLGNGEVTGLDRGIVLATAIVAVGGVKLMYALLGDRARALLRPQYQRRLTAFGSLIMIGVGLKLIILR